MCSILGIGPGDVEYCRSNPFLREYNITLHHSKNRSMCSSEGLSMLVLVCLTTSTKFFTEQEMFLHLGRTILIDVLRGVDT